MEQNSDRMGFALIALVVVAFVLVVMNTVLQPTVKGFFNNFQTWMTSTFNQIGNGNATAALDGLRLVLGK